MQVDNSTVYMERQFNQDHNFPEINKNLEVAGLAVERSRT